MLGASDIQVIDSCARGTITDVRGILRPVLLWLPLLSIVGCGEDPVEDPDPYSSVNSCPEDPNPEPLAVQGCTITAGARPNCLVRRHAVIECESFWSFGSGVRVAADADGAMLATGSGTQAWLFRAGHEGYAVEPLPPAFVEARMLLSQDDAGKVAFALSEGEAEVGSATEGQSIHYATRSEGSEGDWTLESTLANGPLTLRDFELNGAGDPRIWYVTAGISHRLAQLGSGEWTDDVLTVAGAAVRHSLSLNDTELTYAHLETGSGTSQLVVIEGDFGEGLGAPVDHPAYTLALPPPRPASEQPGPLGMALVLRPGDEGLHLLGSEGYDVAIPNTARLVEVCQTPLGECSGTCHETASGAEPQAIAAARANDGSVWVGWVIEQLDYSLSFYEQCDEPDGTGCACLWDEPALADASTHTLHLARVADGEVSELVTLAIPPLAHRPGSITEVTRSIDMRAYGDRLAIGLELLGEPRQLRLLEIDIGDR